MKKDIFFSYLAEVIVVLSGFFVFKLVAHYFGTEGFSAFALSKRTISFILPGITLGLGVAIPRYMAIAYSTGKNRKGDSYIAGGTLLLFALLVIFSFTILVFENTASFLFFGSKEYITFMIPIVVMLAGLILFSCIYGYFRGRLLIIFAGIYKAVSLGLFPLFACMVANSVEQQMLFQGFLMTGFSGLIFIMGYKKIRPEKKTVFSCTKEIASYGLKRIPGDFCISGIIAIPAILSAHLYGIVEAGFVAFGITILNILSAAFAPIGLILLPKVSELFVQKKYNEIRIYIKRLVVVSLLAGISFFIISELATKFLLELIVGEANNEMVSVQRYMMLASLFIPLYISLRNINDAIYERAANAANIYKASLFMVTMLAILYFAGLSIKYLAIIFAMTYCMLSVLTIKDVIFIYQFKDEK
jgi:O-antigen/teichoic acid export membrane protein